jgi:tetratricopeptide (TPR) repeat protein
MWLLRDRAVIAESDGDYEVGRRHATEMLALASELENRDGIFFALLNLGLLAEDLNESEAFLERSARVASEAEDEWQLALVTINMGFCNLLASSYERAFAFSDEAAKLWRQFGHASFEAIALTNAGSAARELGRLSVAAERLAAGLRVGHEFGVTVIHQLGAIAALELARGDAKRAACLTGAAQALWQRGFIFEPFELSVHERTVAELEQSMDRDALETALSEGVALSLDEAVAYALECADR